MNKKVLITLEYTKIIEMLVKKADSPLGKESAARLVPLDDVNEIQALQTETSHALMRIYKQGNLSFTGLKDIRGSLIPLGKGATLGMGELLSVSGCLDTADEAIRYNKKNEDLSDALTGRFTSLDSMPDLNREIKRCIISPEEMADDASSTLRHIRRAMKAGNDKIHEQLTATMNSSATQTMLQDNIITVRNGRYCVPVKQEYKSTFPGMIHDQSASGSTYFMEPMAVVKLNNQLAELVQKEQEEIQIILTSLSALAAPEADTLARNIILLAELDFIFAKAKLSREMQGSEPLFDENYIQIKKGRHPLIAKEKVVPIDIELGKNYGQLIITGPNTGGKTVSLKTVGLFTLMGQSGLHIPAFDHSHLRVFHEVYADIGDEQSIEQSLSTFSSHMTNNIRTISQANEHSLVLFDELGAGTDPTEGAALAMSILDDLRLRHVTTMATTHYPELKLYALSTENVENASFEFDMETMQPTYRLLVGIPGKSNAFAISSRLGLPKSIVEDAESRIDSDAKSFEDVVTNLENTRIELEKEKGEVDALRLQIKKLEASYVEKNQKIDAARDKLLARAREDANDILQNAKNMADDSIRKYNKWMKGAGDSKDMEHQRSALGDALKQNQKNTKNNSNRPATHKVPKGLKIGDLVFVHSMGVKGTVSTLPNPKGDLFVQMGILRSSVNVKDLEPIEEETITVKRVNTGSGKIKMSKAMTVATECNLIGMKVDEAIPVLDKYLDDAYLSHLHQVSIIHGVGTGALKKAVQAHLKKINYVKSFRQGEFGEGGYGVTIVEFK